MIKSFSASVQADTEHMAAFREHCKVNGLKTSWLLGWLVSDFVSKNQFMSDFVAKNQVDRPADQAEKLREMVGKK